MKITWGSHSKELPYPDAVHSHITKEIHMTNKQKTILARLARTVVATVAGLLAAWLAGPNATELVSSPQMQSFIVMVIVPTLITLDKVLRYGADEGEE